MIERPTVVEDRHLVFLDKLRDSEAVNMFCAMPIIQRTYGLDSRIAASILQYWMDSFEERHPNWMDSFNKKHQINVSN